MRAVGNRTYGEISLTAIVDSFGRRGPNERGFAKSHRALQLFQRRVAGFLKPDTPDDDTSFVHLMLDIGLKVPSSSPRLGEAQEDPLLLELAPQVMEAMFSGAFEEGHVALARFTRAAERAGLTSGAYLRAQVARFAGRTADRIVTGAVSRSASAHRPVGTGCPRGGCASGHWSASVFARR